MQVKITRNTIADGKPVRAGQVYDLPAADARALMQLGKAVAVEAVEAPPEVLDTVAAAAVVDTDAPKAKRGRRAK